MISSVPVHAVSHEHEHEHVSNQEWSTVSNLGEAASLHELVDLPHGGVPRQLSEVVHQVSLLHIKQRRVVIVHQRLVPERSHVHSKHLHRDHQASEDRIGARVRSNTK